MHGIAVRRLMFSNWAWVSLSMVRVDVDDGIDDDGVSCFQRSRVSLSVMEVAVDDGIDDDNVEYFQLDQVSLSVMELDF